MSPDGVNYMRWDCKASGCFNVLLRPKLHVFAKCFPGRINFGDVDGWVELNGFFCVLEWKGSGGSLGRGQEITFERFTRQAGNIVFVVEGNAEHMTVARYFCYWDGRPTSWREADLERLQDAITSWAMQARTGRFDAEAAA